MGEILIRDGEEFTFPRIVWQDEAGNVWQRPNLDFMLSKGWSVKVLPVVEVTQEELLASAKIEKLAEIKDSFIYEMESGIVVTHLGWPVDARRADINNDFENMSILYNKMTANGLTDMYVKGADNQLHNCSLADISLIVETISDKGLSNYQQKHMLEMQLDAATSIDEVASISWQVL